MSAASHRHHHRGRRSGTVCGDGGCGGGGRRFVGRARRGGGEKSSMKIDDTRLNQYLIENLKPLTEADPTLLADYVAALLKNSKSKKELQKLCIDQLYDFLGEGTNTFVANLFLALDDGTVPSTMEDLEGIKSMDTPESIASGVETRISPPHLERQPSTGAQDWEEEIEEEESSDEDRNHKHRRRVSRSRSTDRTDEPTAARYNGGVSIDIKRQGGDQGRGVSHFDRDRPSKFDRRLGRDHAGNRFNNGDQGERGMMRGGGAPFRGDAPNPRLDGMRMGRGRSAGAWVGPMPPPFADAPPLLPPSAGFFPNGRGMPGRGAGWPGGFGPLGGMGSGPMEHAHPGRGPPAVMNLGLGMGMGMGPVRPRCLDFEERGFCLRGDLCPMDHGSHIVVEDVQSLSKFNLPVTLPNGRGMVMATGPMAVSNPMLPSTVPLVNRGNRGSREPSIPPVEVPIILNGQVPGSEPDLYDPDQPLWNKERPEASARIRKLTSFHKDHPDEEREIEEINNNSEVREINGRGTSNGGSHGTDAGATVWDRIGPVASAASMEGKLEEQRGQGRGVPWQSGRWGDREIDSAPANVHANPGRGRGAAGWAEAGTPFSRPKESINLGPRAPSRNVERAQRTLYVSCIPPASNRAEILLLHFEKFGHVVDVRIPPHSDRAFVQFGSREEAELALASPDAVMGNRFIRLSWANRDSILSDNVASTSFTSHMPPPGSEPAAVHTQLGKGRGKLGVAGLNGMVTSMSGATIAEGGSKATTLNGSASSLSVSGGTAVKKQEELEAMREKIRQKQEALDQKRDDFRRKLDKLAGQGVGGVEEPLGDQASKRQKLDVSGEFNVRKESAAAASSAPSVPALKKTGSGEIVAQAGMPQQSLKPTKSSHPRISPGVLTGHASAAWGPARFKLDNRTTVFRILPPLPANVTELAALREHFAFFGELLNVEVEDAEGHKVEVGQPLNTNNFIRVSYNTRWSAEKAMTQGRWFQGQSFNLAWAPISSSSRAAENSAPTNKAPAVVEHEVSRSDVNDLEEEVPEGQHIQEEVCANLTDEPKPILL